LEIKRKSKRGGQWPLRLLSAWAKWESGANKVRAWICQAPQRNRSDGVDKFFSQDIGGLTLL
jgi:hypothetical protein